MKHLSNHKKIIVGSDHVAVVLKDAVIDYLTNLGFPVLDVGTYSEDKSVDYPDFAQLVAHKILSREGDLGIAICGTGIGMSIAANKVPGIRAALCHDPYTAHQARAHNDANVLCMGTWIVSPQRVRGILDEWISTEYENGRHQQRLLKLENPAAAMEKNNTDTYIADKIKFGVSLSPNTSVFGPLLFAGQLEEGIKKAAENGFDVVELSLRDPKSVAMNELHKLLSKYNLDLAAIATGQSCLHDSMCLGSTKKENVQKAVKRLEGHFEIASEFSAAVIIGGIRGKFSGNTSEKAEQRMHAIYAVRACAEKAVQKNVQLLIEPINRYETNFINSAEDGYTFIKATGHPEIKLLLDTFHMNLEEKDIGKTILKYADQIGYIHFADSNRKAPGWGHIPFHKILAACSAVNYQGVITAEILPLPDDNAALQQASAFFTSLKPKIMK